MIFVELVFEFLLNLISYCFKISFQIPGMILARKLSGCAKVMQNGEMSIVVAGGHGENGNMLKSVEILTINLQANSASTWAQLGELSYARSYFPSVGIITLITEQLLIVTAGKLEENEGEQSVEYFEKVQWLILDSMTLRRPKFSHSTVSVKQDWCHR